MSIDKDTAKALLYEESDKIFHLIYSQKTHLCFAQCPAFEEVVDTQLFGFSKQVKYASAIGVIEEAEGHKLLSDLETALNDVYTDYYNSQKSTKDGAKSQ